MPGLHKKPKGYVSDAQRKAVHASKKDGGKGNPNKPKMYNNPKAKFPDLSGDGKVTKKDILMGRGVIDKPKMLRKKRKNYA